MTNSIVIESMGAQCMGAQCMGAQYMSAQYMGAQLWLLPVTHYHNRASNNNSKV